MRRVDLASRPSESGNVMSAIEASAVGLRAARREDCRRIGELLRISSEGIAGYVWSRLQEGYPGLSLLEIGERRYERVNTAFSYQNCVVAERAAAVIGMLHAFLIEPADREPAD